MVVAAAVDWTVLGVVLGAVGIVIGIISFIEFHPAFNKPFERSFRWLISRSWAVQLRRERSESENHAEARKHVDPTFVYPKWKQELTVLNNGDQVLRVEFLILNISDSDVSVIEWPVYFEANQAPTDLWAKHGRRRLTIVTKEWNLQTGTGVVAIQLSRDMKPGDLPIRLRWGYRAAGVYEEGPNWFEHHLGSDVHLYELLLSVDDDWKVPAFRVDLAGCEAPVEEPLYTRGKWRWKSHAPPRGCTVRADWELAHE